MSDEPECNYSATLMVLGDDLIPQVVTRLLGLEPSRSWRRGERKSFVRHGGALHYFESVHEWGGWKCLIPESERGAGLAAQLAWWCGVLEGRGPAMRELEARGYTLLMDCFVGAGESASVEVSADLQRRLSGLGLNLRVCFSPDARPPVGEAEQADAADRE